MRVNKLFYDDEPIWSLVKACLFIRSTKKKNINEFPRVGINKLKRDVGNLFLYRFLRIYL